MDIKERMEQLRREMEQRRKNLEDRMNEQFNELYDRHATPMRPIKEGLGKEDSQDTVDSPHEEDREWKSPLIHHEGLEGESKAKLGMFERLYSTNFPHSNAKSFKSFGYTDIDFSPVTNLLAGIGEIELYMSLRLIAKDICGIELDRKKSTYGDFTRIFEDSKCREYLNRYMGDIDLVIKQLRSIRIIRNSANHKGIVTEALFNKFFTKYYVPFFNETIKALIPLKGVKPTIERSSTGRVSIPKDDGYAELLESTFSSISNEKQKGNKCKEFCVVWTDTNQLAIKYACDVIGFQKDGNGIHYGKTFKGHIAKIFENINIEAKERGDNMCYLILDVADPSWTNLLGSDRSWQSYMRVLEAYRKTLYRQFGITYPMSLFILGGDDVIPMPKLRNPMDDEVKRSNNLDVLESSIEVDWLYSFPEKLVKVNNLGYLELDMLSDAKAVFYVSRLPLETGLMASNYIDDIPAYLTRALHHHRNGMKITKVGAIASENCRKIMDLTIKGFPRCNLRDFNSSFQYQNTFHSPNISLDSQSLPPKDVIEEYIKVIRGCQMITMDLHGGPHPNNPGYAGEAQDRERHTCAFVPDILSNSEIKVIVPICCWGARYIGYSRKNSTLLYSFYNAENLLFMGSCRTSYGSIDAKDGEQSSLSDGSWLMRLFMQNLMLGYRAGEALHRAKVVFLKKYCVGWPTNLLTVQEFNLFGDPMLRFNPTMTENEIDNEMSSSLNLPDFSRLDYRYTEKVIYESNSESSILNRVRNIVDNNLYSIREKMNNLLYRHYNIPPENLKKIMRFNTGRGVSGMRFVYSDDGPYPCSIYVYSDDEGELKKIVYSK